MALRKFKSPFEFRIKNFSNEILSLDLYIQEAMEMIRQQVAQQQERVTEDVQEVEVDQQQKEVPKIVDEKTKVQQEKVLQQEDQIQGSEFMEIVQVIETRPDSQLMSQQQEQIDSQNDQESKSDTILHQSSEILAEIIGLQRSVKNEQEQEEEQMEQFEDIFDENSQIQQQIKDQSFIQDKQEQEVQSQKPATKQEIVYQKNIEPQLTQLQSQEKIILQGREFLQDYSMSQEYPKINSQINYDRNPSNKNFSSNVSIYDSQGNRIQKRSKGNHYYIPVHHRNVSYRDDLSKSIVLNQLDQSYIGRPSEQNGYENQQDSWRLQSYFDEQRSINQPYLPAEYSSNYQPRVEKRIIKLNHGESIRESLNTYRNEQRQNKDTLFYNTIDNNRVLGSVTNDTFKKVYAITNPKQIQRANYEQTPYANKYTTRYYRVQQQDSSSNQKHQQQNVRFLEPKERKKILLNQQVIDYDLKTEIRKSPLDQIDKDQVRFQADQVIKREEKISLSQISKQSQTQSNQPSDQINKSNLIISQIEELKNEPKRLSDHARELHQRIIIFKQQLDKAEESLNQKQSVDSNQQTVEQK